MASSEQGNKTDCCPLCGGPNACAMALPADERPSECWCVSRRFPASLLARAPGGACICASCLDEHESDREE